MAASYQFPKKFIWGAATASAQIEGAATEDGKSESIWDRFPLTPGKVVNGDAPTVACDHYHRFPEDIALLEELGIRNYRFSVAWPRIIPDGRGAVNEKGLDFYDRLVDAMLERGITPWTTLFHWDLPQVLEDEGGWRVRSTVDAFAVYADTVVKRLGDRVKRWMTVNEIPCFIGLSYDTGIHAPGAKESKAVVNQAYHHGLLAHGHGVRAVREHGGRGAVVGIVHNPDTTLPVTETHGDIAAAKALYIERTEQLMGPLFKGEYSRAFLKRVGSDQPKVEKGDLELISAPTDFFGLNLYAGFFVRAGTDGQPQSVPLPPDFPLAALPWLNITPQTLYWAIRFASEVYGAKTFYITENGCCMNDEVNENGEVLDLGRREYCRNYLISLHRAIEEGFDVRGYFLWSFLDNYEWAEGYSKRFGIVHVDYETQKRTPKLSARWYSEVIKNNAVV